MKKNKPPPLTEIGKAIRERDAEFERDYSEAIKTACSGNATRLVNLLRAHRRPVTATTLTDDDLDRLADFIEATVKRKRGRERNTVIHEAAKIAEAFDQLLADWDPNMSPDDRRTLAANKAVEQIAREYQIAGNLFHDPTDPDKKTLARQVLDLMGRSKDRRRSKPRRRTKRGN